MRAFAITGQIGYQIPTRSFDFAQNVFIPQVLAYGKEIAQIDFHLLVSALRATSTSGLAAALAATALSYLALVGYDVSGLRYARARAPLKSILLASFCGFAVGNCVGLGAFSGGAVRYRL